MSDFTFWDILRNLLTGLQWTLPLSLVAFIGGGIVGLLILVMRISKSPLSSNIARTFEIKAYSRPISLFCRSDCMAHNSSSRHPSARPSRRSPRASASAKARACRPPVTTASMPVSSTLPRKPRSIPSPVVGSTQARSTGWPAGSGVMTGKRRVQASFPPGATAGSG